MKAILLECAKHDFTLFRNNVGTGLTPNGHTIRYGVCNPGGSDLIGWKTVTVTPDMVGKQVALFAAVEVKTETGRASEAQLRFLEAVRNSGGVAILARSDKDLI